MLNRRDLLLAGAAALAASPAAAQTADGPRLTALMDKAMQDALSASPQLMTLTGLDTGANAPAKHRLDDRSVAGPAKMRALFATEAVSAVANARSHHNADRRRWLHRTFC